MYEPGDKREPRRFEPPPWERDAAQALRVGEQPAHSQVAVPEPEAPEPGTEAMEARSAVEPAATGPQERDAAGTPPDEQVDRMLAALHDECADDTEPAAWLGLAVNVALVFFGVAIGVWGAIGAMRAAGNPLVIVFSLMLMVLGAGMTAVGVWIGKRATSGKD